MQHVIDITAGDLLEFDLNFTDASGAEFVPSEGDQYFFEVEVIGEHNLEIKQDNKHFRVSEINLAPGKYPFAAGFILASGERVTVLRKQSNVLRVYEEVLEDV